MSGVEPVCYELLGTVVCVDGSDATRKHATERRIHELDGRLQELDGRFVQTLNDDVDTVIAAGDDARDAAVRRVDAAGRGAPTT